LATELRKLKRIDIPVITISFLSRDGDDIPVTFQSVLQQTSSISSHTCWLSFALIIPHITCRVKITNYIGYKIMPLILYKHSYFHADYKAHLKKCLLKTDHLNANKCNNFLLCSCLLLDKTSFFMLIMTCCRQVDCPYLYDVELAQDALLFTLHLTSKTVEQEDADTHEEVVMVVVL